VDVQLCSIRSRMARVSTKQANKINTGTSFLMLCKRCNTVQARS
jgi:hypothetical protein